MLFDTFSFVGFPIRRKQNINHGVHSLFVNFRIGREPYIAPGVHVIFEGFDGLVFK